MSVSLRSETSPSLYSINTSQTEAMRKFIAAFQSLLKNKRPTHGETIFLCIGTDRVTGDCLGPLIGSRLKTKLRVTGTLDEPVHAKNLDRIVNTIYQTNRTPFVIAIDASLGYAGHVGFITMGEGALKPGTAVKKALPPVGDVFITGIVNAGGLCQWTTLQNTRLATVVKLSDFIANGILLSL